MPDPIFGRLTIIGIGLIGSSIARGARDYGGIAGAVVICDADPGTLDTARALGLGDVYEADPARAVDGADAVILCTPVGSYAALAQTIGPHLKAGAVLSDVGSTKQSVLRDVSPFVPAGVAFVPGHPMTGTEFSGPEAGFATLFAGRWTLITPPPGTPEAAVESIRALWLRLGAEVARMDAAHHDRVCAIVSHLPHLIAFTICGTADDLAGETREEVLKFAASGFRDFTRIAASDPVMWRDVFLNNKDALLEMFGRFQEDAQAMARAVRWGDTAYIEDKIVRSRKIRKKLIDLHQA
jgi:cyclohexadieny/prephenate dehydrogenase